MERRHLWAIALLSTTLISLEVLWTRIFSAEYFYTFAFLVISIAVLGLGLGALVVRLIPRLARMENIGVLLAITTVLALVGPAAVLRLKIDFAQVFKSGSEIGKLLLALDILALPFFTGGIALAWLFRRYHGEIPRFYMADLVGAGLGALGAVWAMNVVGVHYAAVLVCLPVAAASVIAAARPGAVHAALAALILVTGISSPFLLDIPRKERGPVIYRQWDAMGRLKIHEFGPTYRNIQIDNVANSPVFGFDGDFDGELVNSYRPYFQFKIQELMADRSGYKLVSLGSGGGGEVLQALVSGAAEVHAVEINPAINRLMTDGELTEFTGRIYHDPRVRVVTEDGRTYLRRHPGAFDLIVSSSSNTFAALASGTFALSEDYLFTTEAFMDYWNALRPGGFLIMEHQFYINRAVSEALDALERLGVEDSRDHIAVYAFPERRRMVLVLSRDPLGAEVLDTVLGPLTPEVAEQRTLLYPVPDGAEEGVAARILRDGWRSVAESVPFDIRPCTDDRPFVAQMGLWRNLDWNRLGEAPPYEFYGFPISKLVMFTILTVATVLGLPLLLLPYAFRRSALGAVPWLYFFAIGLGYMAVEVVLIQKYALLIGSSAYTFVVVLLTLLVGSGIGSRLSPRVPDGLPFLAIGLWLLFDVSGFPRLVGALAPFGPWPRLLAAVLILFPLGLFMGMPFPKAAARVGEKIDWGFAVNGVASVLGATGILLVSMEYGFTGSLALAGAIYAAAWLLLKPRRAW